MNKSKADELLKKQLKMEKENKKIYAKVVEKKRQIKTIHGMLGKLKITKNIILEGLEE